MPRVSKNKDEDEDYIPMTTAVHPHGTNLSSAKQSRQHRFRQSSRLSQADLPSSALGRSKISKPRKTRQADIHKVGAHNVNTYATRKDGVGAVAASARSSQATITVQSDKTERPVNELVLKLKLRSELLKQFLMDGKGDSKSLSNVSNETSPIYEEPGHESRSDPQRETPYGPRDDNMIAAPLIERENDGLKTSSANDAALMPPPPKPEIYAAIPSPPEPNDSSNALSTGGDKCSNKGFVSAPIDTKMLDSGEDSDESDESDSDSGDEPFAALPHDLVKKAGFGGISKQPRYNIHDDDETVKLLPPVTADSVRAMDEVPHKTPPHQSPPATVCSLINPLPPTFGRTTLPISQWPAYQRYRALEVEAASGVPLETVPREQFMAMLVSRWTDWAMDIPKGEGRGKILQHIQILGRHMRAVARSELKRETVELEKLKRHGVKGNEKGKAIASVEQPRRGRPHGKIAGNLGSRKPVRKEATPEEPDGMIQSDKNVIDLTLDDKLEPTSDQEDSDGYETAEETPTSNQIVEQEPEPESEPAEAPASSSALKKKGRPAGAKDQTSVQQPTQEYPAESVESSPQINKEVQQATQPIQDSKKRKAVEHVEAASRDTAKQVPRKKQAVKSQYKESQASREWSRESSEDFVLLQPLRNYVVGDDGTQEGSDVNIKPQAYNLQPYESLAPVREGMYVNAEPQNGAPEPYSNLEPADDNVNDNVEARAGDQGNHVNPIFPLGHSEFDPSHTTLTGYDAAHAELFPNMEEDMQVIEQAERESMDDYMRRHRTENDEGEASQSGNGVLEEELLDV